MARCAVLVFPGTWSDGDCHHVLSTVFGAPTDLVWHKDENDLSAYDIAVIPGGFSYGDYLRPGAIARFSPVMRGVERMAKEGGTVIGICNGFQILCEAGLLPGSLLRNEHLEYRCQWTDLRVETTDSRFTSACEVGQVLRTPISHGDGNYFADAETVEGLERNDQVVFRYSSPAGVVAPEYCPNGSLGNIAGVVNRERNVLGMMPHPERCCEAILGGEDGAFIFRSMLGAAGAPVSA